MATLYCKNNIAKMTGLHIVYLPIILGGKVYQFIELGADICVNVWCKSNFSEYWFSVYFIEVDACEIDILRDFRYKSSHQLK